MRNHLWTLFLLALVGVLGLGQITAKGQMNMISMTYGVDGEPPDFSYQLIERGKEQMTCKLIREGKTLEEGLLPWRSDLQTLDRDIIDDFARTSAQAVAVRSVPGAERKRITIICSRVGLETTVAITGSDESLTAFIEKSTIIKELFAKVSLRKPKLYRLWETPGPLSQTMVPLSPEEKATLSRGTKRDPAAP